jgi:hypothetical protein
MPQFSLSPHKGQSGQRAQLMSDKPYHKLFLITRMARGLDFSNTLFACD